MGKWSYKTTSPSQAARSTCHSGLFIQRPVGCHLHKEEVSSKVSKARVGRRLKFAAQERASEFSSLFT